jgi:hypothetical protein
VAVNFEQALLWVGFMVGSVLWAAVLVLLALFVLSFFGWALFAKTYRRADGPMDGERFRWCSVSFGWLARYNSCVTVVVAKEGLWMQLPWMLRFCHPALLLPYRIVTSIRRRKLLRWNVTEVAIRDGARKMKVYLPARAWKAVSEAAGLAD